MKRLLLSIIALLLAVVGTSAQGFADFRVEGGASFNFASLVISKEKPSHKNMTGYHLGAFADFKIYKGLFVGTGLKFSMKGNLSEWKNPIGNILKNSSTPVLKTTFHYLEIPINVGYKFSLSPSLALALQTGPYFSIAMAGTTQGGPSIKNLGKSYNIFKDGFANLSDDFKAKRFDIGWGFAARVYYSRYYVTAGLDLGFLNVLNNRKKDTKLADVKDDLLSLKNKQAYVGIGISF